MINLSKHIEYQLLYHDTVVVPHLGTFKAIYVPCKWIEEEEILLPPYRALSFTHEADETDTRFIETISANYQLSTDEAYIVILEFTENIQQELNDYGSYELGSIGEFVQEEATGEMQFVPCQAGVASPWLYGLDAIHAQPINDEFQAIPRQEKKKTLNSDAKHVTISINKRFLHYVASVAAAIVLFFGFSTPVSENLLSGKQDIHSEFFFPHSIFPDSQAKSVPSVKRIEGVPVAVEEKTDVVETNAELTTENVPAEETTADLTYAVVLCCGVPIENAESYCQKLNEQGIKAIVDTSGKFLRVLIPGFTSREDALAEVHSLRSLSKEFSNAWIMEKK